jgi:hypothetical protein
MAGILTGYERIFLKTERLIFQLCIWLCMALVDYFRGERIRGRVIDVYNTDKNNLGAVVEADNGSRYAVNFSVGNNLFNLYGLLAPPPQTGNPGAAYKTRDVC